MLATGAHAADPGARHRAPPPVPAPWSWTGFYVGGTVGAASERSLIENDPASTFPYLASNASNNNIGVIGGFEAGYNFQLPSLVLGIEGDISWASLNHNTAVPSVFGVSDTYTSRLNDLSSIRGRIGLPVDRALFYGTGGVAFVDLKNQLSDPGSPFTATPGSHLQRWVAGGGIEYALMDHWTVKAEYLHVALPDRTAFDSAGGGYGFDFKNSLDIGRVGINYKF